MNETITYVGLDVHKETIVVALADGGSRGDVRSFGQIVNTPAALSRLLAKLIQPGRMLKFCYEAGPCGYGIQRQLSNAGHECVVVAPSLIPKKPGDRIKTDRRDASNLARLHRAGELTAVWIPDVAHEAMRDLVRARLAAVRSLRQARQQLSGFLLRHGFHYSRPAWTQMHRRWLAGLRFGQPIHNIVLEDHVATIEAATERRDRLTKQIEATLSDWSLAPVVVALQSLRGMALVTAATIIAELGDLSRFTNPRQLMAYLGLVPSEHSSGGTRRQGGITKAGNTTARRMLIEAAELSISCKDKPRAIAASGTAPKDHPRHGMEGPSAPVQSLPKAHEGRKASNNGDHGDRTRTIGLRLGDCMPGLTALTIQNPARRI